LDNEVHPHPGKSQINDRPPSSVPGLNSVSYLCVKYCRSDEETRVRKSSPKRELVFFGLALAGLALGSVVAPAHAGVITYVTPPGSTTGGGPVSDSATFTTSANTLTIVLNDLLANPKDVAQLLSDLSFTLGNGGSLTGATQTAAASSEITVAGDGSFTGPTPISGVATVAWPFTVNSATEGTLDVLAAGGAGPSHLIIGPPGGGNTYSAANGSIAGNGPHNPFLFESATFTITGLGITADTTITSATFSFGTTSGLTVDGVVVPEVPEPGSFVLSLCGIGVVVLVRSYRSRRRPAVAA